MSDIDAGRPKAIESTRVLVGEGVEEQHVFEALLSHLGISGVQVEQCGGKSKLSAYLRTLKTRPGFARVEKVGVVRDADDDASGAVSSVRDLIAQAQLPASVTVSSLILPGGAAPGALENLCLQTIAEEPIETCVESYMTCAAQATGRPHISTTNKAKARIHTWLAAQEEPDLRLGIAARKGLLNLNSPTFGGLKAFLTALA